MGLLASPVEGHVSKSWPAPSAAASTRRASPALREGNRPTARAAGDHASPSPAAGTVSLRLVQLAGHEAKGSSRGGGVAISDPGQPRDHTSSQERHHGFGLLGRSRIGHPRAPEGPSWPSAGRQSKREKMPRRTTNWSPDIHRLWSRPSGAPRTRPTALESRPLIP